MKSKTLFATILFFTFFILSCDKPTKTVLVDNISLNKQELSLYVSQEFQLIPTISPENATNKTVIWHSNDERIAIVSQKGLVIAISPGIAKITVISACERFFYTCTITVTEGPAPVTGISLNLTSLTLAVGKSETLKAAIEPENAANQNVVWTSSNEDVATVSNDGVVKTISEGSTIITVTTEDGMFFDSCNVFVYEINNFTFTVTNSEQWSDVIVFIRENGNFNSYTIYVEDDFEMPVDFYFHFPDITYMIVEIIGNNKKIPKIEQGKINITAHQTVTMQDIFFIHSNIYQDYTRNLSVVGEGAIFNMKGDTTITNSSHSGIVVSSRGTFNMFDGTITNNNSLIGSGGGGVIVGSAATFVMSGGLITGNRAFIDDSIIGGAPQALGSGVYVSYNGTFIMTGGTISNNYSENWYTGAVALWSEATFLMLGGTISNERIGLTIEDNYNTFIMSGGTIYGTKESGAPMELANLYRAIRRSGAFSVNDIKYGDGTDILPHVDGFTNSTAYTVVGRE